MYDIRVDAARNLVEVTLSGMMSVAETARYMADLKHAISARRLDGSYVLVLDVSDCPIQSREMMQAMGSYMAAMPRARAIALVTGSALARLQLRRLFVQPYARIVATPGDARAWVLAGIEPPAKR